MMMMMIAVCVAHLKHTDYEDDAGHDPGRSQYEHRNAREAKIVPCGEEVVEFSQLSEKLVATQ